MDCHPSQGTRNNSQQRTVDCTNVVPGHECCGGATAPALARTTISAPLLMDPRRVALSRPRKTSSPRRRPRATEMDEKQARCAACNARNAYVVDQAAFKRAGLGPITRAWAICSGTENGATTQSVAAEETAYRASRVPGPAPRVTAALRIGRLAWSCHVSATERSRSSRGLSARALLSEPIGGRTYCGTVPVSVEANRSGHSSRPPLQRRCTTAS